MTDKRITPERENRWTPLRQTPKSPVWKRTNFPLKKNSPTVGDTNRKTVKKRFQNRNYQVLNQYASQTEGCNTESENKLSHS